MKKTFFCLLFLLSGLAFSQDWKATYDAAVACAKMDNKPLILVFSGSDWCAPCIKLDKAIWQSEVFKAYAQKNYVLYRADFPRKKSNQPTPELTDQHRALAERFNAKGHFPLVVVLDQHEKVLGTTGFKKIEPKEYIIHLNSFIK